MQYTLRDATQEYDMPMSPNGSMDNQTYLQCLKFDSTQLPELMLWRPGEKYLLVVEVRQKEYSLETDASGTEEEGEFEVLRVGALDSKLADLTKQVNSKLNIK